MDDDDDSTVMGSNAQKLGLFPRDRSYLIVIAGPIAGKLIGVTSPLVFGRGNDVDIRIDREDSKISRKHCRFYLEDDEAWIEDLKSSNGTFVNGQRATRQRLNDGDKIKLGETTILKFTSNEDDLEEAFHRQNAASSPDRSASGQR